MTHSCLLTAERLHDVMCDVMTNGEVGRLALFDESSLVAEVQALFR